MLMKVLKLPKPFWGSLGLVIILAGCASSTPQVLQSPLGFIGDGRPASPPSLPAIQTTLKTASDPQDVAQEPVVGEPEDIWSRFKAGSGLPPEYEDDRVGHYIDWHQQRPEHLDVVIGRAEPYMHFILEQIEEREMPSELILVPMVESAFQAEADSPGRAAGLWQFIPSTGRHLGLRQDSWYDGRRDIYDSTQAALDYLSQLYERFDRDWLVALAAYNAGQGTVSHAIRQNRKMGLPVDYWHLDLPGETRHYVPKILALKAILEAPEEQGVELPFIPDEPKLELVELDHQLELSVAAELAGMELDDLHALNPGFNRQTTPPDGPHRLLFPRDRAADFTEALASRPGQSQLRTSGSKAHHIVQPGDTLSGLAKRHGVSVRELARWNDLRMESILRPGQSLILETDTLARTRSGDATRVQ